jgi:alkanesulfonate monooxygenase SsuD/methylene tetrahydromethanopterin reductase-like flavin-dependent oxidoreductase (luciferase family)
LTSPACRAYPKPVQQPHPPIIVGGTAKPRTVDAAIRFADEYNTVFPSLEEARDRRRVLESAARDAGREPLVYSMMISCVVGRDRGEVRDRVGRWREITGETTEPPVCGTVDEVVARSVTAPGRCRTRDAAAPRTRGRRDGRPARGGGRAGVGRVGAVGAWRAHRHGRCGIV